jgi:hypothetical protein
MDFGCERPPSRGQEIVFEVHDVPTGWTVPYITLIES